jgi:hypothetical protein
VGRHAVEEPAVVGDDEGGSGEFEQGVFEGAECFHVEIVGGFVEQEDVAPRHEGFGKVQPPALAAGEFADLLALIRALEIEAANVSAAGCFADADVAPALNECGNNFCPAWSGYNNGA